MLLRFLLLDFFITSSSIFPALLLFTLSLHICLRLCLLSHSFPTLLFLSLLHFVQLQPVHMLVSCSLWFFCDTSTSTSFLPHPLSWCSFPPTHITFFLPTLFYYVLLAPSPPLISPISLALSLTPPLFPSLFSCLFPDPPPCPSSPLLPLFSRED